ncbi:MAG: peptidylprolyl isomerase [Vicinamibacterales bacterium]
MTRTRAVRMAICAAVLTTPIVLSAQGGPVLARAALDGRPVSVTTEDLKLEVLLLRRAGNAAAYASVDSLEPVLSRVLTRKLLAAEAARQHIDRDPMVTTYMVRSSDAALVDSLTGRVGAAVDTSEAAVKTFFEAHADQFRSAPRRKVRHIVVPTEADAKAAREAIAGGATFETVARARNTDKTRESGGDLGWFAQGSMVKAFDDVVFAAEKGAVAGPVQTAMGWHLVLVEDVDAGSLPPLPLVRDKVIEAMRQDAMAQLTKRLVDEAKPVIDRAALEELLK